QANLRLYFALLTAIAKALSHQHLIGTGWQRNPVAFARLAAEQEGEITLGVAEQVAAIFYRQQFVATIRLPIENIEIEMPDRAAIAGDLVYLAIVDRAGRIQVVGVVAAVAGALVAHFENDGVERIGIFDVFLEAAA